MWMAMYYSPLSNLAAGAAQSGARGTGGLLGKIPASALGAAAGQSDADA